MSLKPPSEPVIWARSAGLLPYRETVAAMEAFAETLARGEAPEMAWLLEHPALYTAGTSARDNDLIDAARLPVHRTGRGGQFTYHGPGQRVVYLMLDLNRRGPDLHRFVAAVEDWLIAALATFGLKGERRQGRVGVWIVRADGREEKIAAIGVRLRRWVTFHGASLNVAPDLEHYAGIVPCGIRDHGVTSLAALGVSATMAAVDAALRDTFEGVFGATADGMPPALKALTPSPPDQSLPARDLPTPRS